MAGTKPKRSTRHLAVCRNPRNGGIPGRVGGDRQLLLQWTDGECDQLLPGIPNEITLAQVATKLPWAAFHILALVSRGWHRAIRSRQVYDARIRSQSAQKLVAMLLDWFANDSSLDLYSVKDDSCYHLPTIPQVRSTIPRYPPGGIPKSCQCVSLDGKLYVLGGFETFNHSPLYSCDSAIATVYMLDLASQNLEWKQCASMKCPRAIFGCGVIGEKIYVFGGSDRDETVHESEVYDPKRDTWSSITPTPSFGFFQKVTPVGEELFVHSGHCYKSDFFEETEGLSYSRASSCAEVYHPSRDDWREIEHFNDPRADFEIVLMIDGKFHKLKPHGIEVYDDGANSWKPIQEIASIKIVSRVTSFEVTPDTALHVDEELLAIGCWENLRTGRTETCLMKSQGLGRRNKIVWQKTQVQFPQSPNSSLSSSFLCPILL